MEGRRGFAATHQPFEGPRPPTMTSTTETTDRVIIRFAGDSGDGMHLTASLLYANRAALGNDL